MLRRPAEARGWPSSRMSKAAWTTGGVGRKVLGLVKRESLAEVGASLAGMAVKLVCGADPVEGVGLIHGRRDLAGQA